MSTLERGSRIGDYTLIGRHWDGGLGDVWIARRTVAAPRPRLYAVRVLDAPDEAQRARLMAWGCSMGLVDEPNIARVLDLVVDGPRTAIVSELVVGESARQVGRVVRGWSPLLAMTAINVLARTLQRLHEMRGEGREPLRIRHGALDAHQVIVDYERPRLVLLDPGLADALHPIDKPECRDDVYALGLLLWELLTGRPAPDVDPTAPKGPKLPPAKSTGARTTKALEVLLRNSIAADRSQRYSSLAVFITELEHCLDAHRKPADLPTELRRIQQHRLQHRAQATRTLVSRWMEAPLPLAPGETIDLGPQPAQTFAIAPTTPLPRRRLIPGRTPSASTTYDLPPGAGAGRRGPVPRAEPSAPRALAEPMPIQTAIPMPPVMFDAATEDLALATSDLPEPKASVLTTFRQLTWLGILGVVALIAGSYAATEGGRATFEVLIRLLRDTIGAG